MKTFHCAVLSAVKHDYVARGMASHPRFELAVVADDPQVPAWAHERNQQFADANRIPYVRDVERALREFNIDVAIVSPESARHCDLSIRAALVGKLDSAGKLLWIGGVTPGGQPDTNGINQYNISVGADGHTAAVGNFRGTVDLGSGTPSTTPGSGFPYMIRYAR